MVGAMKIRLPAFAALLAAAAPATAAERRFLVTDFDRIQVEGPFEVELTTGRPSAAIASGSSLALDRVSIDVQGRTLRVRPNRSAWGGYPGQVSGGTVRIVLSTRDLRAAAVSGPGTLAIDRARGLKVELTITGSGTLAVAAVDADQLVIGLTGSGRIGIAGKAKTLRASIRGSGDLDGAGFRADDADIVTETAGKIAFTAIRAAKVRANGVGKVAISGAPACTVTGLGGGNVRCGTE
jgi:hypothetical protein